MDGVKIAERVFEVMKLAMSIYEKVKSGQMSVVDAEASLKTLAERLAGNDAAADAALDAKFPPK